MGSLGIRATTILGVIYNVFASSERDLKDHQPW